MLWIVVLLTVALAAACFQVVRGQRQYDRLLRLHDEVLTVPPALVTPVLASVAQALGDGVLVFQPDRRIIFSNAKLAEILELSSDHVVGNTLITVLRDYHADALIEQAMTTGERQTTTIQPVLSERRLLITCQPLDAPHKGGGVVVVRDLTQLAYLERARRELVANVSHELRTPLASILLLVETLHSEPPPALARRMLGQIEDEAQALTQLVDELRELAQIESGRLVLQVQTLPLVPVLERAVDRLRAQAERRNLALLTNFAPDLPAVLIDPDRISQVFLNLLHNALKYTRGREETRA